MGQAVAEILVPMQKRLTEPVESVNLGEVSEASLKIRFEIVDKCQNKTAVALTRV
jgi:hypothetical protein